jgi:hypothetical protein
MSYSLGQATSMKPATRNPDSLGYTHLQWDKYNTSKHLGKTKIKIQFTESTATFALAGAT